MKEAAKVLGLVVVEQGADLGRSRLPVAGADTAADVARDLWERRRTVSATRFATGAYGSA